MFTRTKGFPVVVEKLQVVRFLFVRNCESHIVCDEPLSFRSDRFTLNRIYAIGMRFEGGKVTALQVFCLAYEFVSSKTMSIGAQFFTSTNICPLSSIMDSPGSVVMSGLVSEPTHALTTVSFGGMLSISVITFTFTTRLDSAGILCALEI